MTKSYDDIITIASPLECKLQQACRYRCEYNLIKNFLTLLGDWEGKPEDQ